MKDKILYKLLLFSPAGWALVRAVEYELLLRAPFNKSVLDIGCGDGSFAKVLLSGLKRNKFEVGLDLSEAEIAKAKKSESYRKTIRGSVLELPFRNNSFSTVFSNGTLEHIEKIDKAISEISRVLKAGGKLVITVPSKYFTSYLFFKFIPFYGKIFNRVFRHHNLLDHRGWGHLLGTYGLKIENYDYYNPPVQVKIHDTLTLLALPAHLNKMLFGRWILFPKIRIFTARLINKFLVKMYHNETSKKQGGSLFIVATKK